VRKTGFMDRTLGCVKIAATGPKKIASLEDAGLAARDVDTTAALT